MLKCRLPWCSFPSKLVYPFQMVIVLFFFAHIEALQVLSQPGSCEMVVFLSQVCAGVCLQILPKQRVIDSADEIIFEFIAQRWCKSGEV